MIKMHQIKISNSIKNNKFKIIKVANLNSHQYRIIMEINIKNIIKILYSHKYRNNKTDQIQINYN
jgi:hypothetical protein